MNTLSKQTILELIEAGIQAPSADNGQPWKFRLLNNGFELWLDHHHMGLFFDVNQVATLISCGALVENVMQLSKAYGLSVSIEWLKLSENQLDNHLSQLATLTFKQVKPKDNHKIEQIKQKIYQRHTNRNLFKFKQKIPESTLAELSTVVCNSPGYHLIQFDSPKERQKIIKIITATDALRFNHSQVHHDFYQVLRFGDDAKKTGDGLADTTLGIENFMIPLLKQLKPWPLTKFLNYFGFHHLMALRSSWLPLKSASSIVAITHSGQIDYIEAGQIMQQFWIEANYKGLSVQPLGALPLFLARLHLMEGKGFTEKEIAKLKALTQDFWSAVNTDSNFKANTVIMLFRLGLQDNKAIYSFRRPLKSFILEK